MSATAVLLTAFYSIMAASLGFAWIRGGRAERVGVVLVVGMAVFRISSELFAPARFATLDLLSLIEDLAGFAGFTWIGLRARRYWPLWAAALQLLSLGAHFARAVDLGVHPMIYSIMKSLPTLMVCLVIAVGAATYRRRRKRALSQGSAGDPGLASWRRHSPG
jgi:hypothetical protein